MLVYLYIALGGALGAVARYAVGGWVHGWAGTSFPWGTLAVNVLGAFLLGFAVRFLEGVVADATLRALVTIGFLGAFTTFSTFSYETVALLRDGELGLGTLYVAGSVVVGLAGAFLGLGLAGVILRRGS